MPSLPVKMKVLLILAENSRKTKTKRVIKLLQLIIRELPAFLERVSQTNVIPMSIYKIELSNSFLNNERLF